MVRNTFVTALARSVASAFKATVPVTQAPQVSDGSWWGTIRESFPGAWQANVVADPQHTLLAFSAVYACVALISGDISKLRPRLMTFEDGVWRETVSPAFSPVLRKPNRYQTRVQFLAAWVCSKLLFGNSFILKERDARGVVVALYALDPRSVKPLVADDGSVYYQVGAERLIGWTDMFTVPASEIIHDRTSTCFFHPLIGVPPLFACGISATHGGRIQQASAKFFENQSRPSGMLTAPGTISDETAKRLKAEFESNFSGANIGRLLVAGDNLKYEAMTIPAQQAQLIETLRWTVEDIARTFMVPLHKIGAGVQDVKFANMAQMDQAYFNCTLGHLVESMEVLLDEGLGLASGGPQQFAIELDLEGLLRMDPLARAERNERAMSAGWMSPDEARATEGLPRLPHGLGAVPWVQMQDHPMTMAAQDVVMRDVNRRLAEVERELTQ